MAKNDGWAEVRENQYIKHYRKPTEQLLVNWQVVINHFAGDPEVWAEFETEQKAREEMVLWNTGNWGEGFTYSAEWLKKQIEESKG